MQRKGKIFRAFFGLPKIPFRTFARERGENTEFLWYRYCTCFSSFFWQSNQLLRCFKSTKVLLIQHRTYFNSLCGTQKLLFCSCQPTNLSKSPMSFFLWQFTRTKQASKTGRKFRTVAGSKNVLYRIVVYSEKDSYLRLGARLHYVINNYMQYPWLQYLCWYVYCMGARCSADKKPLWGSEKA